MANKQIVDYATGNFDTTQVILSQPAAGGIYKKLNLSALLGLDYVAVVFNQAGTSAPSILASQKSIAQPISMSRLSESQYLLTATGAFPQNKTLAFCQPFTDAANFGMYALRTDNDNILLQATSFADDGVTLGWLLVIIIP